MAQKGKENLVPNSKRTPSERRENARKAGIASGKARRQKANIKRALETILALDVPESKMHETLENANLPTTMEYALIFNTVAKSIARGRPSELATLRDLLNQDVTLADRKEQKARTDRMNAETLRIEKELAIKTGEEGAGIAVMQQTAIANMINTPETERVLQDFLGPAEEVENASKDDTSGNDGES